MGKRRALTVLEKHQICKKRMEPGHMKERLSDFGKYFPDEQGNSVPTSTLSDVLRDSKKWLAVDLSAGGTWKKKERKERFPVLEAHLVEWVDRANIAHVLVTDFVLRSATEALVEKLLARSDSTEDYREFRISNGWIQNVKQRHGMSSKKTRGDGGEVDETLIPQMREDVRKELDDYALRDTFNCDELALQYNLQPDNTISRGDDEIRGDKKKKLRISVFLTCNASGSEKLDAMVIGRAAVPLCFWQAKINTENLPVVYRHNKKAWMLSGIWYEYLDKLNQKMKAQGRHIVLVTDNCPSHPPIDRPPKDYVGPPPPILTNVKLVYLPKNTTPFLQPLDQGIIRSFKAAYRRKYAFEMVRYFNKYNKATPPFDILQAIHLIAEAWDELPSVIIYHCWQKAGISSHLFDSEGTGNVKRTYDQYIEHLQRGTVIDVVSLLNEPRHSDQTEEAVERFLYYDEDSADPDVPLGVVDIKELIANLEKEEDRPDDDELNEPPPPTITTKEALDRFAELIPFFERLSVNTISPRTRNLLEVSDVLSQLRVFESGLKQHYLQQKRQRNLDAWVVSSGLGTADSEERASS